jgi:hypothetical protein
MSIDFRKVLQRKPQASTTSTRKALQSADTLHYSRREGQQTYRRWIRWPVPPGQDHKPDSVEVAGSFTGWQKVRMVYDPPTRSWTVALHDILANRTHRYVILVDGRPSYDTACDGLALPEGPQEARYQIQTDRGPLGHADVWPD